MKDLSKRRAVLCRFGYDGARFFGLQPQPGLPTAGAALGARLQAAASARPKGLAFAARTDRGVHADQNLATCYFLADKGAPDLDLDLDAVARAAAVDRDDGLKDVAVFAVDPRVHARGISRGKHYRYVLRGGCDPGVDLGAHDVDELGRRTLGNELGRRTLGTGRRTLGTEPGDGHRWCIAPALDVSAMVDAASRLRGRHDFSSFRAGPKASSPEKTLFRLDVRTDGQDVVIDLVGDAFLRKMVRNLVGVLCEVGSGWRPAHDVDRVLAARHRQSAGLTAPPQGLTLVAVGSAWPPDGSWRLADCPPDATHEANETNETDASAGIDDDE